MYLILTSPAFINSELLFSAFEKSGASVIRESEIKYWHTSNKKNIEFFPKESIDTFVKENDSSINLSVISIGWYVEQDQLAVLLDQLDEWRLVILYAPPEFILMRAMSEESDPKKTIQSWGDAVSNWLDIYYQNKKNTDLINVFKFIDEPNFIFNYITDYQSTISHIDSSALISYPNISDIDPIYKLIAHQWLINDVDYYNLYNELKSNSIGSGNQDEHLRLNYEDIYYQYKNNIYMSSGRGIMEHDDCAVKNKVLERENQILLQQLFLTQKELESLILEHQRSFTKWHVIKDILKNTIIKMRIKFMRYFRPRRLKMVVLLSTSWPFVKIKAAK